MSTWQSVRDDPFIGFTKKVIVWEGFFLYLLFIIYCLGKKDAERESERNRDCCQMNRQSCIARKCNLPGSSREKFTCGGELLLAPAQLHCNNVWRCDWASDAHLEACTCTILITITITMTIVIITNIIIIVTIITSHHHHQPSCLHALTHHTGS